MNFIRQNTPFVLVWEIELQGTAIKLADTKVSVIASCARGRIDLTDYIDSIEDNTITINQNKGLAFIGDYSLMAIIKSENLTTLKVQEKYVFRTIAKNDPTETESLVSIRSSIVASGGYDSALSEVSQNAIQNAPVAKEFAQVREEIAEASRQAIDEVLGGASEAYDTLLEIEKYIEKDEAGAVALAQSIARLETEKVSKADIDSALSTTSTNPVQNKVITEELNKNPFEKGSGENSAILKGGNNTSTGELSTALGRRNKSTGVFSYSEGEFNTASGARAHAEGCYTKAEGADSHAENEGCIAQGINSHAEGYYTLASGITSHAEGASRADDPEYNPNYPAYATVQKYLEARGQRSHAEGYATQAFGNQSHSEGIDTLAEGINSHAEGQETKALKNNSHSEGNKTISNAADAHTEGYMSEANGWGSHAEGIGTETNNQGEHAEGKYNVSIKSSASDATVHTVGIGTSSTNRKNAHEIHYDGKHYIYGIGNYNGKNQATAKDLATVVNGLATKQDIANLVDSAPETLDTLNELAQAIKENDNVIESLDNAITNKADKSTIEELSEEVSKKPDTTGTYPSMRVGTADDLAGRGESVPAEFSFRASGGKSIKDGRAYIKRIKGNSVVWNQKALKRANSYTAVGVTASWDGNKIHLQGVFNAGGDANFYSLFKTLSLKTGHKYALILQGSQYTAFYTMGGFIAPNIYKEAILEANGDMSDITLRVDAYASTGQSIDEYVTMQITDLTQMFQAGNEPTTIEEFNARVATLGVDMNAYNEGQVIHCNTESIKSVGDNAWDEEWELGTFNVTTGEDITRTDQIRSKNLIKILPNEQYHFGGNGEMWIIFYDANKNVIASPSGASSGNSIYKAAGGRFTTPSNAAFMKFYLLSNYGTTYNHDIMITLVHSGWKQDTDAGYQPYWQDTLPLPIIRKYFPDGMKKAGTAYDEIRFNKVTQKWEYSKGKIKSVDMGTLNWSLFEGSETFIYTKNTAEFYEGQQLLCAKTFDRIAVHGNGILRVYTNAYTDAASFKTAMAGVILYYEAAEWEWVELDAEDQNFRDYYNVADFGTEQSQSSVPSAAFSADIIYQFNAVDMIREHEIEINELQSIIATMQAQLASLTNKE